MAGCQNGRVIVILGGRIFGSAQSETDKRAEVPKRGLRMMYTLEVSELILQRVSQNQDMDERENVDRVG